MAGGKETPRQKMIGMMYLVLTALLALNVSKSILNAFVTINDKIDASEQIVSNTNSGIYGEFDKKRAALKATKGDMGILNYWENKALTVKDRTTQLVSFMLGESNDLISGVEGKDWIKEKDDKGNILELNSLMEINAMDNYDKSTELFVGGNPKQPISRGVAIRDSIHMFRNQIASMMGTYQEGSKKWSFVAPEKLEDLNTALLTANPKDTAKIAKFYKSTTMPETIEVLDGGDKVQMPWVSVLFDHAPVVAAAAMFTAIKLDVKNAESVAAEYMLSKVDAPTFNFNKIEPLAFASTGYINQGDSLKLNVMIAAYDSNEVSKIRYGVDGDTLPENMKEISGPITLSGGAGMHKVKGVIGVKERGEISYKPWEFTYEVGKPSGTVSLPDMRILYRGYDNKVEGAVTGFTGYSLSGTNMSSFSKSGQFYIAKPGRGKECTISLKGTSSDGKSASLGSFKFEVKNLPAPDVSLGSIQSGDKVSKGAINAANKFFAKYGPEVPLSGVNFKIKSWELNVSGAPRPVKGNGATFSSAGKSLLKQAPRGGIVTINTRVVGPDGVEKRRNMSFTIQ